jgi:hypothetical protein
VRRKTRDDELGAFHQNEAVWMRGETGQEQ